MSQLTKSLSKFVGMDGTIKRTPETAKDETTVSPDLFTQGNVNVHTGNLKTTGTGIPQQ